MTIRKKELLLGEGRLVRPTSLWFGGGIGPKGIRNYSFRRIEERLELFFPILFLGLGKEFIKTSWP